MSESDSTNVQVDDVLETLDEVRRSRPSWWRDGDQRDAAADQRDIRSGARDRAADSRDRLASERDDDALQREEAAIAMAVRAHARLDRETATDTDMFVAHTQASAELNHIFTTLRALPGVPVEALQSVRHELEYCFDRVYVAINQMSEQRRSVRSDLETVARHLDAATTDRLAGAEHRAMATADRQAAQSDREHARAGRRAAALDRAAQV